MSFLALFNSDGAPFDSEMIRAQYDEVPRNVKLLGPARQTALMWADPDTDLESKDVRHPVELNERFWLLGRVRFDRRDELCAVLSASETEPDALLCLRAYARWGEKCVDHLCGDFSFVLWDEVRQILLCARDQLGVRPVFYACVRNTWVVSDSLATVAGYSGLTGDLDDFWIADFLTNAYCVDFDRTVYKNVKRLAPAHMLVVSQCDGAVKRYWVLQLDEPIEYRRKSEYLDHFHEVLACAVKDRLPQGRVGIAMSGGLDSTTLAAKALEVTGDASRIVTYTNYFDHLIPDEEQYFSALVAEKLKLAHTLRAVDDSYDPLLSDLVIQAQERGGRSAGNSFQRVVETEMASQAKVWFYGEGPDNALTFEWQSYLWWLINRRDWKRLGGAIVQYLRGKEAREWLMTVKKLRRRRRKVETISQLGIPQWIHKDLVTRLELDARARRSMDLRRQAHPWRPRAIASFTSAIWQSYFEHYDPAISGTSLDCRHPFLDLRVLTFMLRTPPIPWARRKRLIREAMRGVLPEGVLTRDKAPLVADPLAKVVRKTPLSPLSMDETLLRFVDPAKLADGSHPQSAIDPLAKLRTLDIWLKGRAIGEPRAVT
jgi:asparagine synthase (glutamine-hydrolysing)